MEVAARRSGGRRGDTPLLLLFPPWSPPLPRDDFVIMHGERASLDPGCNPEKEEEEEEEEEEACLKTEKKVYNTCIILRWCSFLSASFILLTGPFSGYVVYVLVLTLAQLGSACRTDCAYA